MGTHTEQGDKYCLVYDKGTYSREGSGSCTTYPVMTYIKNKGSQNYTDYIQGK